jgi:D-ribose pyranase
MKKKGILHSELARIVAGMGHGDILVICDSGYPIPHGKPVADVVLTLGVPGVIQTLRTVLEELHIENVVVAGEMEKVSESMYRQVREVVGDVPLQKISHEDFKKMTRTQSNISFVRTGEATKYANTMLVAGVVF